jgi:hypothetical protein
MPRTSGLFRALLLVILPVAAHADIAAIHVNALPQEAKILAALDDAKQLEPYSSSFTEPARWNYPVKRDEVAARLKKDLSILREAATVHSDNLDLTLLTGLVAHYAYNFDVEGSFDAATDAFARSEKSAPADIRSPWFRADLNCQTAHVQTGSDTFLAIEGSHPWDELPVAFWDDYMECAAIIGMYAHLLRAADYTQRLHAPPSQTRDFFVEVAHKRYDRFDPKKQYEPKEVWQAAKSDGDVQFTSTTCGVRLRVHGDWRINALQMQNGSCVAYFSTGPYKATTRDLHPSIVLMVRQPKNGESLQEYAQQLLQKEGPVTPDTPSRCPGQECISYKADSTGMYGNDGNGHGRLVAFERPQPAFPGLALEVPSQAPKPSAGKEYYFRASQIQQRIPGTLYYVVLLDVAASIEEPAMKDLDFFLQHLTVE